MITTSLLLLLLLLFTPLLLCEFELLPLLLLPSLLCLPFCCYYCCCELGLLLMSRGDCNCYCYYYKCRKRLTACEALRPLTRASATHRIMLSTTRQSSFCRADGVANRFCVSYNSSGRIAYWISVDCAQRKECTRRSKICASRSSDTLSLSTLLSTRFHIVMESLRENEEDGPLLLLMLWLEPRCETFYYW